jgi:hypothetical protein
MVSFASEWKDGVAPKASALIFGRRSRAQMNLAESRTIVEAENTKGIENDYYNTSRWEHKAF